MEAASDVNIATITALNVLNASIDALCIKTRGFSANIESPNFYEYHSFLNLTIEMMHKASYDTGERVRSLWGIANHSIEDITRQSVVKDVIDAVTDPSQMVDILLPDYDKISKMCRDIFKSTGKAGDAGTVALVTSLAKNFEHFAWELGVMKEGGYDKDDDDGKPMTLKEAASDRAARAKSRTS